MWSSYGYGFLNNCGIGGGFGMMFFGLIIIGLVVYLIIKAQQNSGGSVIRTNNTYSDALEIAKKRLANGEITSEEYEELKKKLQ
ncbi:hypothetical protein BHF71_00190 [Vulcanibacillus modesticaldus]|uniref:SHOCT domain-containing protein n=1 Tax=Vulcanibacillus modesticaldus TaxID=337097 RepID=A0A1D2YXI0_9BACI|nr:SHOCT domain-containing protein [Vulcanibacillus modesticaldus]OEG00363.1 hypothetical protein BHF71_00190 [Vulcanibacillus modesticaldus]